MTLSYDPATIPDNDITIICVNEYMNRHSRYEMDRILHALTRAKHAIYIIGTTQMLQVCTSY